MKKRTCLIMTLMLFFSILAAGCKESPTLEEVRYTNDASEVDTDINQLDPEDWGQLEEQFEKEQKEQSETEREEEAEAGPENQEDNQENSSVEIDFRTGELNDLQSSSAGHSTGSGGDGTAGQPVPEPVAGGENTGKQIVDALGRTVNVPADVASVTAVGPAAQMVEIFGGTGRLTASDAGFLSSALAKDAFSDVDSVQTLWKEDGSQGISADDFQKLLADRPDVCLEISGQATFSSSQVKALESAGIPYVVLPPLSSEENLKHTATLLGQILGGSAVSKAAEYNSWVDSIMDKVSKKASDVTSLYITEWDSDASYTIKNTLNSIGGSSGKGLAVAFSPKADQLISTFMSAAGVTNESTRIRSMHTDSPRVYAAPMFHYLEARVSGSKASFYLGDGEYGTNFDLFVSRQVSNSVYIQLGAPSFPAVVAADEETRTRLESSWFWQYHEVDASGAVSLDGYSMPQVIMAPYEIYVNPHGICSWEASAESPLEACWIAAKFSDSYDLSDAKAETRNFYKKFMGLDLTDAQLTSIFGE